MKTLYKTTGVATGGRDGKVKTLDGNLDLELAIPKELGGPGGAKTNPESLFAAGYAACFHSALKLIASKAKKNVDGSSVEVEIGIGSVGAGAFGLSARVLVKIPGLSREESLELANAAHGVCPYSNAVRGNIPLELEVI